MMAGVFTKNVFRILTVYVCTWVNSGSNHEPSK